MGCLSKARSQFIGLNDYDICNAQNLLWPQTQRMSEQQRYRASFFGARLRARRKALGLSQEKVGVSIGLDESCSRTRISRYETGAHEPAIATSLLLATALGVPLAYLYCEDETLAEIIRLTDKLELKAKQVLLECIQRAGNAQVT